jgi:hypothetical protein
MTARSPQSLWSVPGKSVTPTPNAIPETGIGKMKA